jgi:hypothetical protein
MKKNLLFAEDSPRSHFEPCTTATGVERGIGPDR